MRELLIAAALCLAAQAQVNNPMPTTANLPHFTVKGRVVNAVTGEPVKGALININGMEQHSGFSGADGQFEVDSVPKGHAMISAMHPGYSNTLQQRPQMVDVSDNVDGVTVKLPPTARISGTVRDSDGEPVEGLRVSCMQVLVMQGRKHLMPNGGATTDEGGHFVVDNLQAGSYYLSTGQKAVYPGLPPADEAARLTFAPQYYPNAPDPASAQHDPSHRPRRPRLLFGNAAGAVCLGEPRKRRRAKRYQHSVCGRQKDRQIHGPVGASRRLEIGGECTTWRWTAGWHHERQRQPRRSSYQCGIYGSG